VPSKRAKPLWKKGGTMIRVSSAFIAAIVIAVGITPVAAVSPALADPKPAIDLCRDVLLPARPASNLGECLSYINVATNDSEGVASHQCDFLMENDPFTFDLLFVTRSECIRAFGGRGRFN
jgi:hypothetical protein